MRRTLAALIAVVAAATILTVVFVLKIGPVVYTISDGRGVHSGDLAALAVGAGAATFSWTLWRTGRRQ